MASEQEVHFHPLTHHKVLRPHGSPQEWITRMTLKKFAEIVWGHSAIIKNVDRDVATAMEVMKLSYWLKTELNDYVDSHGLQYEIAGMYLQASGDDHSNERTYLLLARDHFTRASELGRVRIPKGGEKKKANKRK